MSSAEEQVTRHIRHRGWSTYGPSHSTGASTATGLRRVDWVRLVVEHDTMRAEAVGTGYRLPTSRPIPLAVAAALIGGGTPSVTRRLDHDPAVRAVDQGPDAGPYPGR